MLASLIRLRQSQSANKGSNCDQGERWTITLSRRNFVFLFIYIYIDRYVLFSSYQRTNLHLYMKVFTYVQSGTFSTHASTQTNYTLTHKTGHCYKSKSNCHESHCHRGNSGRLHAEHILSYLWWVFFSLSLFVPHTHTDITNFQLQ